MEWLEICIHTSNEAIEPISNVLSEIGTSGIVIKNSLDLMKKRKSTFGEVFELNPEDYPDEGVYVKTYIPNNHASKTIIEQIKRFIENLRQFNIDIGKNHLTVNDVDEEEWSTAWKKYYKPVQVSDKITVKPTWDEYTPKTSNELIIELDPGMAFGTGTHATTQLSLRALEKYVHQEDLILDVGCGSGVLSIASILLGAKRVLAYDLDEVAVKSTTINAELNQVNNNIDVNQNNLLEGIDNKEADIIVSNILAEIIIKLTEDAWCNLKSDGLLITSGIIKDKEKLVIGDLQEKGFNIIATDEMDGWISIIAKKI